MRIRSIIEELIGKIHLDEESSFSASFNFDLQNAGTRDVFHVFMDRHEIALGDGPAEGAMGQVTARESTLQSILDLGIDPVSWLMNQTLSIAKDAFQLPDIHTKVYLESATPDGQALQFNLFIEHDQLHVVEGGDLDSDIRIKVAPRTFIQLIKGEARIPMAILTGKIKISNKARLMKLLGKLGLNM